jgi:hypothetical protein
MTFGQHARDLLREAKRKGEVGWDEVAAIIDAAYRSHCAANRRPCTPDVAETIVDPLFLALCRAEGSEPARMTAEGKRQVAIALTAIQKACPEVTSEKIERAAMQHRRQFSGATVSAFSLSKNWGRLHIEPVAIHASDPTDEPPDDWRDRFAALRPDHPAANTSKQWRELPRSWRDGIRATIDKKAAPG